MIYKITIKSNGQKRIEEANGVQELHSSLALYRRQGWKITNIKRVNSGRKLSLQALKSLIV